MLIECLYMQMVIPAFELFSCANGIIMSSFYFGYMWDIIKQCVFHIYLIFCQNVLSSTLQTTTLPYYFAKIEVHRIIYERWKYNVFKSNWKFVEKRKWVINLLKIYALQMCYAPLSSNRRWALIRKLNHFPFSTFELAFNPVTWGCTCD